MSRLCANLINAWTVSNIGNIQERDMSKFISQKNSKLTLATIKDALSFAIFVINGIYIDITHFAKLNMVIQRVLTFCKILLPFAFIRFASFKIQCAFSGCEK
jgi:hypothetical protein